VLDLCPSEEEEKKKRKKKKEGCMKFLKQRELEEAWSKNREGREENRVFSSSHIR
jgi:hypothetical protein